MQMDLFVQGLQDLELCLTREEEFICKFGLPEVEISSKFKDEPYEIVVNHLHQLEQTHTPIEKMRLIAQTSQTIVKNID